MLLEDLQRIDSAFLQRICDDKCPESETLDFKRELPGSSDKDKHEVLKDVSAMANAAGGDIVYGISELDGSAESLAPIATEPADVAKRRLAQVLDAGLEPRCPGLKLHHAEVPGGYVLIVRVPSSYDGPHCIRSNHNRRFVLRNGTGTSDMSYEQVRSAFDRTASLSEQARKYVGERVGLIAERKTPTRLLSGPAWVLHFVPLAGIAHRQSIDLRPLYADGFLRFLGSEWGGGSRTFNFDGLAVHPGAQSDEGHYAYNHIFRNGVLEAAQVGGGKRQIDRGGPERMIVWSLDMSHFFYRAASLFLDAAKGWGFAGPAMLGVALLNVEGYELGIGDVFHRFSKVTADRPHLVPPAIWINDIDRMSLDDAIRPSLDMLWQAFGLSRCLDFDEGTGVFKPRSR